MRRHTQVILLFIIILGIRLTLAGATPHLYEDESYYHLRNVEGIREGENIRSNELTGRQHIISPVYDYIIAVFTYIIPFSAAIKLIPNILATSFVIVAYLIAYTLTKDHYTSFLTGALSGFIPIYFVSTFNHLTIYSIVLPLMGLLIYYFIHLEEGIYGYCATLVLLSLIHPSVLIFAAGLLMYMLILFVEKIKLTQKEREVILFTIIFVLWSQFILYKRIFLVHGWNAVWQNLPSALLNSYFQDFSILGAIYLIDAVPFLFGLYAIRQYLFKIKDKNMYFLISIALSIGLILWTKLIPLNTGLILLGMIMVLLFPKNFHKRMDLLSKSRFSKHQIWIKAFLLIFFLATAVGASIHLSYNEIKESTIEEEYYVLERLNEISDPGSMILNDIVDGNKIMAIAERPTMIDSDFLMVRNSDIQYEDMKTALTSPHITQVAEKLEKYNIEYIYLSPKAKERLEINKLPSANEKCLPLVYDGEMQIYEWRCKVIET